MKVLAVMLALAIFTGSPTPVLSNEPVSKWELLRQNVNNYIKNNSRVFEQQLELVRKSAVLQEVKEQAHEGYVNISQRFRKLGQELPKETKETLDLAVGVPIGVAEDFIFATHNFFLQLAPATRNLYDALEPVLAPRAKPVLEKVRPYADVVRDRIQEMGRNRTEKLKSNLEKLEALGPEIKEVLKEMREVREALLPLADAVQNMIRQKAEAAAEAARPYVSPVLEAAKKHTAGLKQWVTTK